MSIAGLGGHGYPLAVAVRRCEAARVNLPRWTSPVAYALACARLDDAGCEALLVTHLTNVRYLTGFTGSAAALLVQPDDLTFVTDGRYEEQAAGSAGRGGVEADIVVGRTLARSRRSSAAPGRRAASASRPST